MTTKYIAGHYQVKLGVSDVIGDTDGIYISWAPSVELIDMTDSGGRTPIDGIYRGGNCYITINVLTTDPVTLAGYMWPFSATMGLVENVGALVSAHDFALTLTAFAGTNSATTAEGVYNLITASHVIPAPETPISINLAPSLWRTTLRFQCIPYVGTSNVVWFVPGSTTAVTQALGSGYIAGAVTATWNSQSLGDTELNSVRMEWMHHYEQIQGDAMGDTTVDMIYQGSSAYFNLVMLQANAAGIAAIWPYGTQGVIQTTAAGPANIGRLHTDGTPIGKALALTPVANTPAAGIIASIGAACTTLAPGFEVQQRLGPTLRKVPLRLICFPSSGQLFTITAA